jgi:hypothetical protein
MAMIKEYGPMFPQKDYNQTKPLKQEGPSATPSYPIPLPHAPEGKGPGNRWKTHRVFHSFSIQGLRDTKTDLI